MSAAFVPALAPGQQSILGLPRPVSSLPRAVGNRSERFTALGSRNVVTT